MNYVVSVLEPLPADLTAVAEEVAKGLPISPDNVLKLLRRAPGPVTRAVPERNARMVQEVMQAAGLVVEVREGSLDGPVVDLVAAAAARSTAAGVEAALERTGPAWEEGPARAEATAEPHGFGASEPDGAVLSESEDAGAVRRTSERLRVPEAGQTATTPPRDPMRTTLVRTPPRLERTGLRRRIASAVTLPALLTLIVTLLVAAATLLPVVRQQEQARVDSVVAAVAATVEGLSGGLPLSAPLLRLELDGVQARGAAGGWGLDHLLLVDADETPLVAWYRGRTGIESLPPDLRAAVLEKARNALGGSPDARSEDQDWLTSVATSGRELLALAGFDTVQGPAASAVVRRQGAISGAVVAGGAPVTSTSPAPYRAVGVGLLTALLVGLVPILFGLLATLSLTRGLRESIGYLLVATDRISHGDLDAPVELARDDELGQIARGVERMRISLRESMERLRQRR